jgi:hypothetical protein
LISRMVSGMGPSLGALRCDIGSRLGRSIDAALQY